MGETSLKRLASQLEQVGNVRFLLESVNALRDLSLTEILATWQGAPPEGTDTEEQKLILLLAKDKAESRVRGWALNYCPQNEIGEDESIDETDSLWDRLMDW